MPENGRSNDRVTESGRSFRFVLRSGDDPSLPFGLAAQIVVPTKFSKPPSQR